MGSCVGSWAVCTELMGLRAICRGSRLGSRPSSAVQSARSCCAWGDREVGQRPRLCVCGAPAALSTQHPPKRAGAQQQSLPLFGHNAFTGAEKHERAAATRILACKDHQTSADQSQIRSCDSSPKIQPAPLSPKIPRP